MATGAPVGLHRLWQRSLDLLFPPRCVGCGREGAFLCEACLEALPRLEPPYCAVCAEPTTGSLCTRCQDTPLAVDGVRAPFRMEGAARKAVHALKYSNLRALAPELARLMAQHLEANPIPGDALVPVPLHPKRLRERGYNQAELLARSVGKLTGLPILNGALARARPSAPQVSLASREARAQNVQGAFQCARSVEGLAIILVDDVVTT
ncbi:MAG: ComF family protein, partial [Chloroflexota bacterium]|nr:ComF family protein [Chloroflexota bacterium]